MNPGFCVRCKLRSGSRNAERCPGGPRVTANRVEAHLRGQPADCRSGQGEPSTSPVVALVLLGQPEERSVVVDRRRTRQARARVVRGDRADGRRHGGGGGALAAIAQDAGLRDGGAGAVLHARIIDHHVQRAGRRRTSVGLTAGRGDEDRHQQQDADEQSRYARDASHGASLSESCLLIMERTITHLKRQQIW